MTSYCEMLIHTTCSDYSYIKAPMPPCIIRPHLYRAYRARIDFSDNQGSSRRYPDAVSGLGRRLRRRPNPSPAALWDDRRAMLKAPPPLPHFPTGCALKILSARRIIVMPVFLARPATLASRCDLYTEPINSTPQTGSNSHNNATGSPGLHGTYYTPFLMILMP